MNRMLMMVALGFAIWLPNSTVQAQTKAAEQLYGQGIHLYHAGRVGEAMTAFSDAIRSGSQDPRLFYYRGLAYSSMGNTVAAEADFQSGAQLEIANRSGRNYAVGRSLERVQGTTRLQIEQARRDARLAAKLSSMASRTLPGNVAESGADRPLVIPNVQSGTVAPKQTNFPDVSGIENPGTPYSATELAARPKTETAPATGPDSFPKAAAEPTPTEPAEEPMDKEEADPFGEKPAESEETDEDPFGGDEGDGKKEGTGGDEETDEDPFGGDEGEGKKEGKGGDEEEDDDPFG